MPAFQNTNLSELASVTVPTTTASAQYTVPASTYAKIGRIYLYNDHTGTVLVKLYQVQSGGSVGLTTQRYTLSIPTKTTVTIDGPMYLNAGGKIYLQSDTATVVSAGINGVEFQVV